MDAGMAPIAKFCVRACSRTSCHCIEVLIQHDCAVKALWQSRIIAHSAALGGKSVAWPMAARQHLVVGEDAL